LLISLLGTEVHTAAVVRALTARRSKLPTGHAGTHRKSVAQSPASYSCEDAGYGYPANSQEV